MKPPLVHPATMLQLDNFTASPTHAVLLVAPAGSGKRQLSIYLAEHILGLAAGHFANHPYASFTSLLKDEKSIGIDQIRQLEQFLGLKVPGDAPLNRVVVITEAELLTAEAQNALLKTLEEPPSGTLLIMTATQEKALLPTIRSRVQKIIVRAVSEQAAQTYFSQQGYGSDETKRAFAMTGGLAELMGAVLSNPEHPLLAVARLARELAGLPVYERLLRVDELAKQPERLAQLLFILQQMAGHGLRASRGEAAYKWQGMLEASYRTAESFQANAQPKLALTNLMLSL